MWWITWLNGWHDGSACMHTIGGASAGVLTWLIAGFGISVLTDAECAAWVLGQSVEGSITYVCYIP